MTERERIGWGWTVVVSFLLLAAASGSAAHCQPDESTYVPARAERPRAVKSISHAGVLETDGREPAGKGPAQVRRLVGLSTSR